MWLTFRCVHFEHTETSVEGCGYMFSMPTFIAGVVFLVVRSHRSQVTATAHLGKMSRVAIISEPVARNIALHAASKP